MKTEDRTGLPLLDELMQDKEFARLERQEEFILDVTEAIVAAMTAKNMSRADLATRLGKTRGCVSQYLNGLRNLTCRTVADISYALGLKPSFSLQPMAQAWPTNVVMNYRSEHNAQIGGLLLEYFQSQELNESERYEIQPIVAKLALEKMRGAAY